MPLVYELLSIWKGLFYLAMLYFQAYYYFAIVEDTILRFAWALTVSVGEGVLYEHKEALTTVLASLEVFR